MNRSKLVLRVSAFCVAAAAVGAWCLVRSAMLSDRVHAAEKESSSMMVAHNVYFSLNDPTPANRQKLVDACKKYLSNHPGTMFFAAGTVAEDYDRPVNDRDWDVGLHLVFKDHASHDAYQTAESHLQFISENKADWKKVRVFDTDCSK
ncbi:MAG TPA: Dabb family protein [Pirellulales bacterium]|jgi:hypothetical protein|nr:Dabb family protein [Pirellulales bacterium]